MKLLKALVAFSSRSAISYLSAHWGNSNMFIQVLNQSLPSQKEHQTKNQCGILREAHCLNLEGWMICSTPRLLSIKESIEAVAGTLLHLSPQNL